MSVGTERLPGSIRRTDRVLLRPPTASDLDAAFEIHGDPATNRYNPAGPHRDVARSEAQLAEWLEHWGEHGFGYWAVEEAGEVVGFSGVRHSVVEGEQVLNLYYRYRPSAWGRGFAREVAREAVAFAAEQLPDLPVVAITTPDNEPSLRVAERSGFVRAETIEHEGVPSVLLRGPRVERVRSVDAALRDELLTCWVDVTNAGGAVGFVAPVTARDVAPTLDAALDGVATGGMVLVVLHCGGELAGFGFIERTTNPLFAHWGTLLRLQVHPRQQGAGLGRVLVAGIHGVARDLGLEALRLTYREGLGLGAFYDRCGYVEVGRVPGVIRVAPGDDRDEVIMLCRLTRETAPPS